MSFTHQNYIAYIRVSTQQQGRSGLGLEAQRDVVERFIQAQGSNLLCEYVEVETAAGANALDQRPQLRAALAHAKRERATLLIAKLDRLARNVHFITGLIESGVDFICADMPHANKVMLQMYAVMAEWERDQISLRTRSALAARRARGLPLGSRQNLQNVNARKTAAADAFAKSMQGIVLGLSQRNLTQHQIAEELNAVGIKTASSGKWSQTKVSRLLARCRMLEDAASM